MEEVSGFQLLWTATWIFLASLFSQGMARGLQKEVPSDWTTRPPWNRLIVALITAAAFTLPTVGILTFFTGNEY